MHTRVELVLPLVFVTAGQSLSTPALSALVAVRVGNDGRGAGLGAQQGLSALARIAGPAVGGLTYALLGIGAPFVGGGLVVVVALVFSLVTRASTNSPGGMVVETVGHRLPLSNNGRGRLPSPQG